MEITIIGIMAGLKGFYIKSLSRCFENDYLKFHEIIRDETRLFDKMT